MKHQDRSGAMTGPTHEAGIAKTISTSRQVSACDARPLSKTDPDATLLWPNDPAQEPTS
jgi:hypothetical protein